MPRSVSSTAFVSTGRSRTPRCSPRAGPRRRRTTTREPLFRGAFSRRVRRPTLRCRKPSSRCRSHTASSRCYGRAAVNYASALDSFGAELKKVDASIASIRDGKFLKALAREEIKQDPDWVIQLRSLPESPETYYLTELAASNDFQTAVQNYLDLEDLRRKLASWDVDFDSFDDMIGLRRSYYEPLLPGVDHDFRDADSRMRLRIEQNKLLEQRLRGLLVAPRPDFLATADERLVSEQLSSLDRALAGAEGQQADALRERIRRLQGVITFQLRTQYDDRLAKFNRHLAELSGSHRCAQRALRVVRQGAAGGRAQLRGIRHADRAAPHARVRLAREGKPAPRAAGPHHRARRDRRAHRASRAARPIPGSGALRVGRQLRPRDQVAGRGQDGRARSTGRPE